MFVIAHAGHPGDFLVGFVIGAILSAAFLLLRLVFWRT